MSDKPKFDIDAMCSILKRQGIESSEYTDCNILYSVTFDQLRTLFIEGFDTGTVNYEQQLAAVTDERDKLKEEREQMEKQEPSYFLLTIDNTWIGTSKRAYDTIEEDYLKMKCYTHPPVPDDKVQDMAKVLMGFLAEQSYLHHPSVPYAGKDNGDSPAAWNLRLYEAAVKTMLKAAQGDSK